MQLANIKHVNVGTLVQTFEGPPVLENNALAPAIITKSLCSISNNVLQQITNK